VSVKRPRPEDDKDFDTRKSAFDNLTSFKNGTYTLFPNFDASQANTVAPTTLPLPAQLSLFEMGREQNDVISDTDEEPSNIFNEEPANAGSSFIDWETFVEETSKNAGDYSDPFVVIRFSESSNFDGFEDNPDHHYVNTSDFERMTFADADAKFKEVEAIELAERAELGRLGGYSKTSGVIFYKDNPLDTELSTYEFRYDIGDYEGEKSGLYNHINSFWINVQHRLNTGAWVEYTQESANNAARMISIISNHQIRLEEEDESQWSETTAEAAIESEISNAGSATTPISIPAINTTPNFVMQWHSSHLARQGL